MNENGLIDRDEVQPMIARWKTLSAERWQKQQEENERRQARSGVASLASFSSLKRLNALQNTANSPEASQTGSAKALVGKGNSLLAAVAAARKNIVRRSRAFCCPAGHGLRFVGRVERVMGSSCIHAKRSANAKRS